MKFQLIDKKNRIFGKFHAGFLIVPVGALLIGAIIYSFLRQSSHFIEVRIQGSPGNWWWDTLRPPDWLANSVRVGDTEKDALGQVIAEVKEVNVYDAGGPNKDIYLRARLKVGYNPQTQKYRFKGEPVEIAAPISLALSNTFFPGVVTDIFDEQTGVRRGIFEDWETIEKIVVVKHLRQEPWRYDAIKIGEQVTDGAGTVIAEIIAKERSQAELEVETADGRIVIAYAPRTQDFFITLRIKLRKRGSELVFREEQFVKIGNSLWILAPSFSISRAEIISIQDPE